MTGTRIAVVGIGLECNSFAPTTLRKHFQERMYLVGDEVRRLVSESAGLGFGRRLSELRDWELVPILVFAADPSGPCEHSFFAETLDLIDELFDSAKQDGPIDGVFIYGHGAGTTTELDDLDGPHYSRIRACVGDSVPIVAELDLHANLSVEMFDAIDIIVGYRRNPHTDIDERSIECAELLNEMLDGMQPTSAFVRLPMVEPPITLLTEPGRPYGDLMAAGEALIGGAVANVTILAGFAFSDTAHNGMSVVVTTRGDSQLAANRAMELADTAWRDRRRYDPTMISIEQAAARAVAAGATGTEPIALADCADNPGAGGRGNTTTILSAMLEAKPLGLVAGVFIEPEVVRDAMDAGEGNIFAAHFNRESTDRFSDELLVSARVISLVDSTFRSDTGIAAGRSVDLGPACLLDIGGVQVAVATIKQQTLSSDYFAHVGVDIAEASTFLVKSRGHFRAGFSHLVNQGSIFEVDGPGLSSSNLFRYDWSGLPRPVHPIDEDTEWTASLTAVRG